MTAAPPAPPTPTPRARPTWRARWNAHRSGWGVNWGTYKQTYGFTLLIGAAVCLFVAFLLDMFGWVDGWGWAFWLVVAAIIAGCVFIFLSIFTTRGGRKFALYWSIGTLVFAILAGGAQMGWFSSHNNALGAADTALASRTVVPTPAPVLGPTATPTNLNPAPAKPSTTTTTKPPANSGSGTTGGQSGSSSGSGGGNAASGPVNPQRASAPDYQRGNYAVNFAPAGKKWYGPSVTQTKAASKATFYNLLDSDPYYAASVRAVMLSKGSVQTVNVSAINSRAAYYKTHPKAWRNDVAWMKDQIASTSVATNVKGNYYALAMNPSHNGHSPSVYHVTVTTVNPGYTFVVKLDNGAVLRFRNATGLQPYQLTSQSPAPQQKSKQTVTKTPVTHPVKSDKGCPAERNANKTGIYTVCKGDTLYIIAGKLHIVDSDGDADWHKLYNYSTNRDVVGIHPEDISPGQVLKVPAST